MAVAAALFYMLVFPGFLFLSAAGMYAEWIDRKLCAKLQNRVGPPWFQPLADFIKLAAKQDLVPELADKGMFKYAPVVALAAVVTALFYIPIWGYRAGFNGDFFGSTFEGVGFQGDIIVVLYLLTIPTVMFFIGGWYSRSLYSMVGAARTMMQLFAYEVPLFLAVLGPAILAGTWQFSELTQFYGEKYPYLAAVNVIGLVVATVALLAKLEKVPFDIAEAETEIVGGTFTEYSGRRFAIFRMAISIELIVGSALIAAVFLPFGFGFGPLIGFGLFLVKVLAIICLTSLLRSVFARLRIDQMINFCWKVAAPIAFVQLMIDLLVKGLLLR